MAISVFHFEKFYYPEDNLDRYGNAPVFHHVAEVSVADEHMAEVFRLTNSIDSYWWKNEGVEANFESPAFREVGGMKGTRSTMVGDLIRLGDGRWFRCASFGWDELPEKPEGVRTEISS